LLAVEFAMGATRRALWLENQKITKAIRLVPDLKMNISSIFNKLGGAFDGLRPFAINNQAA